MWGCSGSRGAAGDLSLAECLRCPWRLLLGGLPGLSAEARLVRSVVVLAGADLDVGKADGCQDALETIGIEAPVVGVAREALSAVDTVEAFEVALKIFVNGLIEVGAFDDEGPTRGKAVEPVLEGDGQGGLGYVFDQVVSFDAFDRIGRTDQLVDPADVICGGRGVVVEVDEAIEMLLATAKVQAQGLGGAAQLGRGAVLATGAA